MPTDPFTLGIIAFVLALLLIVVVGPALRLRRSTPLPNVSEWRELRAGITNLTNADLTENRYTEPTRLALTMVLGEHAGIGRRGSIPQALEVLDDAIHSVSRGYRSLSSQSILVGLLGTVAVFARVFPQLATVSGHGSDYSELLAQMGPIYLINAAAVGVSLLLFWRHHEVRQEGDLAIHAATEAFEHLQDSLPDAADPRLIAGLNHVVEELQRQSAKIYEIQIGRVEALVSEVKTLAAGMERLVGALVQQASGGPEQVLGPMRQVQSTVDQLIERLDFGLEALAQPFLQITPAMSSMKSAAKALEAAAETITKSDILTGVGVLEETVGKLNDAVDDLPVNVKAGLTDFASAALGAVRDGISEGMGTATETMPKRITEGIVSGLGEELRKLQAAVVSMNQVAAGLDSGAQRIVARLESMDRTIDELQGRLKVLGLLRNVFGRGN